MRSRPLICLSVAFALSQALSPTYALAYEDEYGYDYSYDYSDEGYGYDYSEYGYTDYADYTDYEEEPEVVETPAPVAEPEKKEPPKPRAVTVTYNANGGTGAMDPNLFTEGQINQLSRCTFTRTGYTFEGWTTEPDGSGSHFVDGADITTTIDYGAGDINLYAQWGNQIYLIRYANGVANSNSTPVEGIMPTQFAVHDAEVALLPCNFTRKGYDATGWMDSHGNFHDFNSVGVNFCEDTSTTSWELATLDVSLARGEDASKYKWTCQGSVVFTGDDGEPWVAVAFINYDDNYKKGNLDTYDSEIIVCSLQTGELKKHASGLMLEHGNDIAYNPDNGHFYVAQGGLHDGLPDGIVELDHDLNLVRSVTPEGTHHIWNITYADGVFYAIGNVDGDSFARGNPTGATSDLIRLDADLNLIDKHAIDFSSQGFSGQGMACDGDELYAILVNFAEAEAALKQRLSIFTLEGDARGTQYFDIPAEVESASWLDGRMYFSINGGSNTTIYGTDLASTTMTCVWKPNTYAVEFDGNMEVVGDVPAPITAEYDQTFTLPAQEPVCPGYVFDGWNTKADGTGDAYAPGQSVMNLTDSGEFTLYAQWKRPIAAFAFVADNGTRVKGNRFRPNARERLAEERKAAQEATIKGWANPAPPQPAQGPKHASSAVTSGAVALAPLFGVAHAPKRKYDEDLVDGLTLQPGS